MTKMREQTMVRPQFDEIKSYTEFAKYYWYRDELKAICKQLGIDSSGMKGELNHNIEEYFKGNMIRPKPHEAVRSKASSCSDDITLTLETTLLACNFRFTQRFREFFSEQTGIKNFKFNTDMVATAKKVREEKDTSFTLGDLLDIFYGRKTYAHYDKSCLQWNKFVRDFCADPVTNHFPNKLKVAAILWREVRNSTRKKVYDTSLLKEFEEKLTQV